MKRLQLFERLTGIFGGNRGRRTEASQWLDRGRSRMQRSCWGIVVSRFIVLQLSRRGPESRGKSGVSRVGVCFSAEVVADRLTKGGALVRKSTATSKMAPAMVRTNLP